MHILQCFHKKDQARFGFFRKINKHDSWYFGLLVAIYQKPKDENVRWTGQKYELTEWNQDFPYLGKALTRNSSGVTDLQFPSLHKIKLSLSSTFWGIIPFKHSVSENV